MIYINGKSAKTGARGMQRRSIYKSWWVLLFIAACSVIYCKAVAKKHEILSSLDQNLETLTIKRASLLEKQEDLLLQINSQSDPAWIQLTLMKGLGLVPEGQLKVYFHNEKDNSP